MVGFLMANLFGHEKQCAWIEEFRKKGIIRCLKTSIYHLSS